MLTPTTARANQAGDKAGKCPPRPSLSDGPKGPGRTEHKYPPFSHPPNERAWQHSLYTQHGRCVTLFCRPLSRADEQHYAKATLTTGGPTHGDTSVSAFNTSHKPR